MDIKEVLFNLSNACGIGNICDAANLAAEYLSEFCDVTVTEKTVIGKIDNGKPYTIMLDAHIDEVGMVVTDVDDNGFLTVAKCGGIDLRHLSAKSVVIHGKKDVNGVFISTPPHLKGDDEIPDSISDIKIDSLLGKDAKNVINTGDFVTYATKCFSLGRDSVCGKSLDNRAGVACLIETARRVYGKDLPCNVVFLLSDAEELGLRGARTAAFKINANEAVVIDVSFGDGPDISPTQCGTMGSGAMIGVSPVLDRNITDKLNIIADENAIPYQSEIMGGTTSTNADVISVTRDGIKTGLISIPLRNMHTDTEAVNIRDVVSVCDILEKYILSGGIEND